MLPDVNCLQNKLNLGLSAQHAAQTAALCSLVLAVQSSVYCVTDLKDFVIKKNRKTEHSESAAPSEGERDINDLL